MAFRRVSSSLLSRRLLLSSATRPNPTPVDPQVWQPSPPSPASPHILSQASPHTSFPTTHPSTAHSRAPTSARARARAPNASPNTHTLLASRAQSRVYARVTPQTPRDSPPGASPGSVVRPSSTSSAPTHPKRARGTTHASVRVLGMNRRQTLVTSRSIARSTAIMTPNACFVVLRARSSAFVVRTRANDAETAARDVPRRGADATRPIIVREMCHVACNNT